MKARTVATATIGTLAVLALAAAGRLAIRLDELDDRIRIVDHGTDRSIGELYDRVIALELVGRQ